MDIEELKKIVRGNGFQESHGSTTMVVDVETVIDLLEELEKQFSLQGVSQQRELLKAFTEKCNKYRTTMEEITPEEIDKFMDSL
jgi:hypothetical protein